MFVSLFSYPACLYQINLMLFICLIWKVTSYPVWVYCREELGNTSPLKTTAWEARRYSTRTSNQKVILVVLTETYIIYSPCVKHSITFL